MYEYIFIQTTLQLPLRNGNPSFGKKKPNRPLPLIKNRPAQLLNPKRPRPRCCYLLQDEAELVQGGPDMPAPVPATVEAEEQKLGGQVYSVVVVPQEGVACIKAYVLLTVWKMDKRMMCMNK